MKMTIASALAVATIATGAFADSHAPSGDAAAGEKLFKKCKSCHTIQDADGNNVVKGGKTGPNLFGVVGRAAASVEGFKYGSDLVTAGEAGLVWDEESFVAYVTDPKKFLRAHLENDKAKSKMTFRLKKGGEDVYAFLASVAPAPAAEEAASE
ncbi:MAG: c-type cytochrome [Pelagimonas sp.]|uniref:c-type cytochrome n=1 Tax=Pelagimonas sp. TaxID=2073170 RepID=UPI003D6C2559